MQPAGFLERGGIANAWSKGGRKMVVDAYGHWLAYLGRTDQLDLTSAPADRVSINRVTGYLEHMGNRLAAMTVQGRIGQLGRAMRALAPEGDWTWLSRAADRLRAEAVPVREKRSRMQDIETIVGLGLNLMERAAAADDHFAVQRAALYRDGLMIALLALRPLRRRSFASISLGRHLTQRAGNWWLNFEAIDMKTKAPEEMLFPEDLTLALQIYLDVYRNVLLRGKPQRGVVRPETAGLWIAKGGRMMGSSAISFQIGAHTKAAFGKSINLHLFRDCAATSIAIRDPEHIRMILPVLTHSSLITSERHYNQARTLEASRQYQQQVAETRKKLAASNCLGGVAGQARTRS